MATVRFGLSRLDVADPFPALPLDGGLELKDRPSCLSNQISFGKARCAQSVPGLTRLIHTRAMQNSVGTTHQSIVVISPDRTAP